LEIKTLKYSETASPYEKMGAKIIKKEIKQKLEEEIYQ
jgi:hypothetical protein